MREEINGDIIAGGVNSDFWREVKKILANLERDAIKALIEKDPKEFAAVSECQQQIKICRELVFCVESYRAEKEYKKLLEKKP